MNKRDRHHPRPGRRQSNSISGQWVAYRIDMIESAAFKVLSLSGRRVLNRLEIEHAAHGGQENGHLPATYTDFELYGIHRHAIGSAIRENVALGFLEITEIGRAGNAEFRRSNRFRLTYLATKSAAPTDEWRTINNIEDAERLARVARSSVAPKKQKPSGGKRQFSVAESALKVANA